MGAGASTVDWCAICLPVLSRIRKSVKAARAPVRQRNSAKRALLSLLRESTAARPVTDPRNQRLQRLLSHPRYSFQEVAGSASQEPAITPAAKGNGRRSRFLRLRPAGTRAISQFTPGDTPLTSSTAGQQTGGFRPVLTLPPQNGNTDVSSRPGWDNVAAAGQVDRRDNEELPGTLRNFSLSSIRSRPW
jgi:hypothetical protein